MFGFFSSSSFVLLQASAVLIGPGGLIVITSLKLQKGCVDHANISRASIDTVVSYYCVKCKLWVHDSFN